MQDFVLDVEVKIIAKPVTPKTGLTQNGPYERNQFVVTNKQKVLYSGAKTDIATLAANAIKPIATQWALSANQPADVSALAPTSLAATTCTLNGYVHPHAVSTAITFERGATPDLGTSGAAAQSPSTSATAITATLAVTGLTANTQYYFRVKVVSGGVTRYSPLATFKTLAAT